MQSNLPLKLGTGFSWPFCSVLSTLCLGGLPGLLTGGLPTFRLGGYNTLSALAYNTLSNWLEVTESLFTDFSCDEFLLELEVCFSWEEFRLECFSCTVLDDFSCDDVLVDWCFSCDEFLLDCNSWVLVLLAGFSCTSSLTSTLSCDEFLACFSWDTILLEYLSWEACLRFWTLASGILGGVVFLESSLVWGGCFNLMLGESDGSGLETWSGLFWIPESGLTLGPTQKSCIFFSPPLSKPFSASSTLCFLPRAPLFGRPLPLFTLTPSALASTFALWLFASTVALLLADVTELFWQLLTALAELVFSDLEGLRPSLTEEVRVCPAGGLRRGLFGTNCCSRLLANKVWGLGSWWPSPSLDDSVVRWIRELMACWGSSMSEPDMSPVAGES